MGKPPAQFRSKKILDHVKKMNCVLTGMPADHAHHIIGVGGYGGMGMKAPDTMVMPVTAEAHRTIHENPELWVEQFRWCAETQAKIIEDIAEGRLVL